MSFISHENENHSHKAEHLTSSWYRGPGELENGLSVFPPFGVPRFAKRTFTTPVLQNHGLRFADKKTLLRDIKSDSWYEKKFSRRIGVGRLHQRCNYYCSKEGQQWRPHEPSSWRSLIDDQFWTGSLRTERIYEYERYWLWTGTQIFRIKTRGSQKEKARKYTWQFMCSYSLPAVKEEEIENTAWQRIEGRPLRKSLIHDKSE